MPYPPTEPPITDEPTAGGRTRTLAGPPRWLDILAGGFLSAWFLYTSFFGLVSVQTHRGILVLVTIILVFSRYRARDRSPIKRPSVWDWIFMAGGSVAVIYWMINFAAMSYRLGEPPTLDIIIFGGILTVVSLEMARRVTGWIIPAICFLAFLYNLDFVGPHLPTTLLNHGGFSINQTLEWLYGPTGVLGLVIEVFATYMVVFVLLGAFMQRSGLGELFIDLSLALTGRRTGGPGLAAVVASSIFGMISGSPVSNVVTSGTFTIPLMKRVGYRSEFAAAVEAAASTGGIYMPPIMGAGAFLLAEFTGVGYFAVVKLAVVPALVYFLSVGLMVYLEAAKRGLHGVPKSEIPEWRGILLRLHYVTPVPVMIGSLLLDNDAFIAAIHAIFSLILVKVAEVVARAMVAPSGRLALIRSGFWDVARMTGASAVLGARNLLPISALGGALGILLGVADHTQLPLRFSELLTGFAGDNLAFAVILVIGAGYFIGMGLPIIASYVVLAIFSVPALTALGVSALTAHFIAFWVATSSSVTPPVALAAYAGAAVAQADPVRTGFIATKLASWIYLMPFLFIYTPLIEPDTPVGFWWITVACFFALVAWSAGLQGRLVQNTSYVDRALFLLAALFLVEGAQWLGPMGLGAYFLPTSFGYIFEALVPWGRLLGFGAFTLAIAVQLRFLIGPRTAE